MAFHSRPLVVLVDYLGFRPTAGSEISWLARSAPKWSSARLSVVKMRCNSPRSTICVQSVRTFSEFSSWSAALSSSIDCENCPSMFRKVMQSISIGYALLLPIGRVFAFIVEKKTLSALLSYSFNMREFVCVSSIHSLSWVLYCVAMCLIHSESWKLVARLPGSYPPAIISIERFSSLLSV